MDVNNICCLENYELHIHTHTNAQETRTLQLQKQPIMNCRQGNAEFMSLSITRPVTIEPFPLPSRDKRGRLSKVWIKKVRASIVEPNPCSMLRYLEAAPEGRQPVQSGEKHCANQKPVTAKQTQRATPVERLFQRCHWLVAPLDSTSRHAAAQPITSSRQPHLTSTTCISAMQGRNSSVISCTVWTPDLSTLVASAAH
jgi:hypothetical protein